jgi:hypothetical protein
MLFNLAMLAKQGWRFVHDIDSLCARVVQAKYFSGDNMFATKTKKRIIVYMA